MIAYDESCENETGIRIKGIGADTVNITRTGISVFGPAHYVPEIPINLLSQGTFRRIGKPFTYDPDKDEYSIQILRNGVEEEWGFSLHDAKNIYLLSRVSRNTMGEDLIYSAEIDGGEEKENGASPGKDQRKYRRNKRHNATPHTSHGHEIKEDYRRLHEALGHISKQNMEHMTKNGSIIGWTHPPGILKEAKRSEGDSETLTCAHCDYGKGKLLNTHTPTNKSDQVGDTGSCDMVFSVYKNVPQVTTLISVDDASKYIDVIETANDTRAENALAQAKLVKKWDLRGRKLRTLRYDGVQAVEALNEYPHVRVIRGTPGTHQQDIEAQIRTYRERIRTVISGLWFTLTSIMYRFCILWVINTLNRTYRQDLGMSPYEKVFGRKLDWDVDLTVAFGDLILCNIQKGHGSMDKLKSVRHLCIVLGAHMDGTGRITVLSLHTNNVYISSGIHRAIRKKTWTTTLAKVVNTILHGATSNHTNPDPGDFFRKKDVPDDPFFATSAEMLQMHSTTAALEKIVSSAGPMMSKRAAADIINECRRQMGEEEITLSEPKAGDYNSDLHSELWREAHEINVEITNPKARLHTVGRIHDDMPGPEDLHGGTKDLQGGIEDLQGGTKDLQGGTKDLQGGTKDLQGGTKDLQGGTEDLQGGTEDLQGGTEDLQGGTEDLQGGTEDLQGGTEDLQGGTEDLQGGTEDLQGGTEDLQGGTEDLHEGTVDLHGGAEDLHEDNQHTHRRKRKIPVTQATDPYAKRYNPRDRNLRGGGPDKTTNAHGTTLLVNSFAALQESNDDPQITEEQRSEACRKEIENILQYNTVTPEYPQNINELEISKRVRMKVITKLKRDGKVKSRAPTGVGRYAQDKRDVQDRFSPTASKGSIILGLKTAAIEKREVSTADVKSAYLNAPLPLSTSKEGTKFRRILELEGEMLDHFLEAKPEWGKYICRGYGPKRRHQGSLFLVIQKALYGLLEAGLVWHDHFVDTLTSFAYKQSETDPCVFHDGKGSSIILYVDDLLLLAKDKEARDDIVAKLQGKYQSLTHNMGDRLDYLNMIIEKEEQGFYVHQKPYFDKVLDDLGYVEVIDENQNSLPYKQNLMDIDPDSPALGEKEKESFIKVVMQLMFGATRTRYKILLPTVFCSTRLKRPTEEDLGKLTYCLDWLNKHREGGICISRDAEPDDQKVYVWADASDNSHFDAKGHSGTVISIGRKNCCPVFVTSKKQSLVARSSTEAEMIAVYTALPQALWTREAWHEWGFEQGPLVMFQDNISAIISSHQGHKPFSQLSHMNRRFWNHKQYIDDGTITMPHCDTGGMLSDCLTKASLVKEKACAQYEAISGVRTRTKDEIASSSLTEDEWEVISALCYIQSEYSNEPSNISESPLNEDM